MIYEQVNLNELYPALPDIGSPTLLHTYCRSASPELGDKRYPAVVICPGGAYMFTSDREAEPIALAFLARGIQCFVLRYHVAPAARYPVPQLEATAAIAYLRANADKYHILPDCISILGFSAGGHLAGSYSTHWSEPLYSETLGIPVDLLRPNGMVLCYGVLSGGEKTHEGSMISLLGDQDSPEMRRLLSTELHVSEDTPPAFIWHTFADNGVPVENSLLTANALAAQHIPFEMHIYPDGCHGLALSNWLTTSNPENGMPPSYVAHWVEDCANWMLRLAKLDILCTL